MYHKDKEKRGEFSCAGVAHERLVHVRLMRVKKLKFFPGALLS